MRWSEGVGTRLLYLGFEDFLRDKKNFMPRHSILKIATFAQYPTLLLLVEKIFAYVEYCFPYFFQARGHAGRLPQIH